MKPLLAHIYEPHRVVYPCFVQPKLNGIRALYQNGRFQSRDELPFPENLLQHLSGPLQKIFGPDVILDGELYNHSWNWNEHGAKVNCLQRINGAVTPVRNEPNEDTLKVEYHIYDTVDFTKSFSKRYVEDERLLDCVKTFRVHTQTEAEHWYNQWVCEGYEGQMIRIGDCPYTVPKQHWAREGRFWNVPKPKSNYISDKDNRTWHLLKRKDWQDDEFECVGVEEGEGKYKGTTGALRFCTNPRYEEDHGGFPHFTASSGLADSDRDFYFLNPPIGRQFKIKYLVLSNDGIPLNPSILLAL